MQLSNGLYVERCGEYYNIYAPNGVRLAGIRVPADGRFISDTDMITGVTRQMAKRWGISTRRR